MLGSGQLIVLGIVGEYLGRLYMEAKRRPLYLVESIMRQSKRIESNRFPSRIGDEEGSAVVSSFGTRELHS